MNRAHAHRTSDRDEEATSVDHRFRHPTIPSSDTEIMDPADLLLEGAPTARYDAVFDSEDINLGTVGTTPGARRSRKGGRVRRHIEAKSIEIVVALLGLVCIIGILAYREHQAARVLQETFAEITRVHSDLSADDPPGPVANAGPSQVASTAHSLPDGQSELPDRAALEREGADLLGANDFEGALAHYRALTEKFRSEPVFSDVVTVLERKRRCAGSKPGGAPACR